MESGKIQRRKVPFYFKLLLPLFGVLVIVAIELILRLFGLNASTRLFIKTKSHDGTPVYRVNWRVSERFFFRPAAGRPVAPTRMLPVEFPIQKSADTFRIIVVGESTAEGFPYPRSAAFSGFLREMLSDLHPEKKLEVINCGVTALNSYAFLDFMPEVVRVQPDLIILYAAHNEFYGAHGVGSLEAFATNRTVIRCFIAMQKTALFQTTQRLVNRIVPKPEGRSETALMRVMARDPDIRRHDRKHAIAEETFRKNLDAIVARAQRARIPILLTTVVSNVKDLTPLRSLHRKDLSANEERRWQQMVDEAILLEKAGRFDKAAEMFRAALQIDPEYAETYYRLGQCLARANQWEAAREAFYNALEYDTLHFRACPVFNQIIREAAAVRANGHSPALLTDLEPAFAKECAGGVIGNELMTEHLHPTLRGHDLIARTICRTLAESPLAGQFGPSWEFARLRPHEQYHAAVGYSPVERYLTARLVEGFYKRSFFLGQLDREQRLAQLGDEVNAAALALRPEERAQADAWFGGPNTFVLHMEVASGYFKAGQFEQAVVSYRTALRQTGQGSATDYQQAWLGVGQCERKLGRHDAALQAYQEALKFPEQHAAIWYDIGRTYTEQNDFAQAEQAFARALELNPNDPDTLINLGIAARQQGKHDAARGYFERAAESEKRRAVAHYHLATLALDQGQTDDAIAQLQKVLALDPKHVHALRLMGYAYRSQGKHDLAEAQYARALELDGSDAATWYDRSCAAVGRGDFGGALEFLKSATLLGGEPVRTRARDDKLLAPLHGNEIFDALVNPRP